MINKELGVILDGLNEIISIELETNNKNFYYLRYYVCTIRPKFYNIAVTDDPKRLYYKCFRCGKKHMVKSVSSLFNSYFNSIYNYLVYGINSHNIVINEANFLKHMIENLKNGDFNII